VWGFIQLALIIVYAELIMRLLLKFRAAPLQRRVLIYALVIGSAAVARSVVLGQTSLLIAVLLWSAVYAQSFEKRVLSAIAAGIAIFVKPFLALVEVVNLFRRNRVAALDAIGVAVALMIVSVIAVGILAHVEYWNLLCTLGSSQTAYSGNQSLYAGLLRLFSDMPVADYGFQFDPGLALLGKIIAAIILAVAAYAQWKSADRNVMVSTGLWISAALLALPISWEHHLLFLIPTVAFLWTCRWSNLSYGVLTASTLLMCVSWSSLYSESFSGRAAASLPLFGDLILFAFLVTLHIRPRAMNRVRV